MKQPGNFRSGKPVSSPSSANLPAYKSLWKGRDGVWEREGKLFFRKVFPPFPNAFHQPCFLKLFLGRERQKASTTRAMVTQNMMAESALMSGFTPSRTIE